MAELVSKEEAARRAFPMLSRLEEQAWDWWRTVDREGIEAANVEHPQVAIVDVVRTLVVEMCGGNVVLAMETIQRWGDSMLERLTREDLAGHRRASIASLIRSIAFRGIGNLFGTYRPDEFDFDHELAMEGMWQGWRQSPEPQDEATRLLAADPDWTQLSAGALAVFRIFRNIGFSRYAAVVSVTGFKKKNPAGLKPGAIIAINVMGDLLAVTEARGSDLGSDPVLALEQKCGVNEAHIGALFSTNAYLKDFFKFLDV